ncbi:MAG: patatin-like phospholipase family protein [Bacteroidia bacterium]|nr:patatin-like phospholipase family protein [Bacteroidia bacterium]
MTSIRKQKILNVKRKLKIQQYWEAFFYSFPVRLIALQLRQHPFLILTWLFVYAVMGGGILSSMGGRYQVLEAEYLGGVGFKSFLLMGAAFGSFIFAYLITLYINASYKFHFLVLRRAPFFTFALNNSIIPGIFLLMFAYNFTEWTGNLYGYSWEFWKRAMGFIGGSSLVFLILSSTFFATTKNIFTYFGESIQHEFEKQKKFRRGRLLVGKAKDSVSHPDRVDNYLGIYPLGIRKVKDVQLLSVPKVLQVLNQNHGNLLFLQLLFLFLLIGLGFFSDYPICQIPLGATGFLALALAMMISGALTFWVRKIGFVTFIILFGLIYGYYKVDFLRERNSAFGMNYEVTPAEYTLQRLNQLVSSENIQADKEETLSILNAWKAKYQQKYGQNAKPFAVFVCTTGGGMRSSLWSISVLQHLDTLTNGKLTDEIRLMTGASGGMMGTGYFRELISKKRKGEIPSLADPKLNEPIVKDLINRVFFQALTDACFPNLTFKIGEKQYEKEKGYAFDKQLMNNVPEFKGKRMGDYREAELKAEIPQMILTPAITNQAKMLYISPVGTSYLAAPTHIADKYTAKTPGIEFRRFFEKQEADSLWFVTALRMNATFPYVLPLVALPSKPEMRTIDAGALENFGISTAVKYIYSFEDWLEENTEGIIFVTIRDTEKEDPIEDVTKAGVVSQIFAPLGSAVNSMKQGNDFGNDFLLQYFKYWYKGKMHIVSYEYPWNELPNPASLSFHLSEIEKKKLPESLLHPHNIEQTEIIRQIYQSPSK